MYARYSIKIEADRSSYEFIEECSLFGCNQGFIPWLLERQMPPSQGEPYKWHLPIRESLNEAKWNDTDYADSALIIDLTPKRNTLSLFEVLDVWGYSDSYWTPILLHLSGLFVDVNPDEVDRNDFVIRDNEREEPIYTFMHLGGWVCRWTDKRKVVTASAEFNQFHGSLAERSRLLF